MVPFILLRCLLVFCCVSHGPLMTFYFILFVHCNWTGFDFTTLSWKASGVSKLVDKAALVAFEKPVIFYDLEFLSAQWIFMLFIIHFVGSVLGEQSGQLCVITRCNFTLFNEAANVCCANNDKKVGFVGVRREWYFCFCFHKFVYYRTRAAPRFRAVRGGTSRVRKSYAFDPARCKTSRRGQGKCISIVVRILFRPLLGPCLGSCLEHATLAENEIAEDNHAYTK